MDSTQSFMASPVMRGRRMAMMSRKSSSTVRLSQRLLVMETVVKLVITAAAVGVSVSALVRMLPQYQVQQERLREMESEVSQVEERVGHLRGQFERYFDPRQTPALMLEQTHRLGVQQRRVKWIEEPSFR